LRGIFSNRKIDKRIFINIYTGNNIYRCKQYSHYGNVDEWNAQVKLPQRFLLLKFKYPFTALLHTLWPYTLVCIEIYIPEYQWNLKGFSLSK